MTTTFLFTDLIRVATTLAIILIVEQTTSALVIITRITGSIFPVLLSRDIHANESIVFLPKGRTGSDTVVADAWTLEDTFLTTAFTAASSVHSGESGENENDDRCELVHGQGVIFRRVAKTTVERDVWSKKSLGYFLKSQAFFMCPWMGAGVVQEQRSLVAIQVSAVV